MNFFDKLKAQVNPFDGGKSFGNPEGRPQLPQAQMAQPMQRAGLRVAQPQPYGQQSIGSVQQNGGVQPFGQGYEDEYTPAAALEQTGYFNPQTAQNGQLLQGNTQYLQQVNDREGLLRKLLGY